MGGRSTPLEPMVRLRLLAFNLHEPFSADGLPCSRRSTTTRLCAESRRKLPSRFTAAGVVAPFLSTNSICAVPPGLARTLRLAHSPSLGRSRRDTLLGLRLLASGCPSSAPLQAEDLEVHVVIEAGGMSQEALATKTIAWLLATVPSARFEGHERANARAIVGHGRTELLAKNGVKVPCDCSLTIEIEDGRERPTFDDWIGQWGISNPIRSPSRRIPLRPRYEPSGQRLPVPSSRT